MLASVASPLEGSSLANVAAGQLGHCVPVPGSPSPGSVGTEGGKATRTYSGAALERRKAWGKEWGQVGKQWKTEHTTRGN